MNEIQDRKEAETMQTLIEENSRLKKIEKRLKIKIEELHKYNSINSQVVTSILEEELTRIYKDDQDE